MKVLTPDDVAGRLEPGSVVFLPGQHAWPRALVDALDRHPECTRDVEL
jgi:hypothetical protein